MLDFICIVFAELQLTGSERKIQNDNMCFLRESNQRSFAFQWAALTTRPLRQLTTCCLNCISSYRILKVGLKCKIHCLSHAPYSKTGTKETHVHIRRAQYLSRAARNARQASIRKYQHRIRNHNKLIHSRSGTHSVQWLSYYV